MILHSIRIIFLGTIAFNVCAAEFEGGMDIHSKLSQQRYTANETLTVARLALQPWLSYGDWFMYGELPFEGRKSTQTNTQTVFARTASGRIIRRISPQNITTTTSQQTDGIADASIGLSYTLPTTSENWLHSTHLEYKFDNGDSKTGLGSGTQDTSVSLLSRYTVGVISLKGEIGYTTVAAPTNISSNNVTYGSVGSTWQINKVLNTSLNYSNQSEPYSQAPDQGFVQLSVSWKVQKLMTLTLTYGDYLTDSISLPKDELSVAAKFLL
ncbi:MAG: hypothetical protein Q7S87_03850 [Agitococcus sp.]|nr:hypothetical protein [Agitococcus sp.]